MTQEVTNFARFYALFNKLPCTGDREGLKKQIVLNKKLWFRKDLKNEQSGIDRTVYPDVQKQTL